MQNTSKTQEKAANFVDWSFTEWLASKSAVSITLAIGVFFLISNYEVILHLTNPQNTMDIDMAKYPFALRWFLSHLDSLFFGLATAIIMFQSRNEYHKILYCIFEAVMIFLNLNQNYVGNYLGTNSKFLLGTYIAVFSGFTLYYLGKLAKQHNVYTSPTPYPTDAQASEPATFFNKFGEAITGNIPHQSLPPLVKAEHKPITGFVGKWAEKPNETDTKQAETLETLGTNKGGGRPPLSLELKEKIKVDLQNGLGVRATAKKHKVGEASVSRIKKG